MEHTTQKAMASVARDTISRSNYKRQKPSSRVLFKHAEMLRQEILRDENPAQLKCHEFNVSQAAQ